MRYAALDGVQFIYTKSGQEETLQCPFTAQLPEISIGIMLPIYMALHHFSEVYLLNYS